MARFEAGILAVRRQVMGRPAFDVGCGSVLQPARGHGRLVAAPPRQDAGQGQAAA